MQSVAEKVFREAGGDNQTALEQMKRRFLASLNYQIRTPLTGILGMTDLLLETSLDDAQREYVVTARLCAEELLSLLDSALEYSALVGGAPPLEEAEFNLPELLENVCEETRVKAHAKGLKFVAALGALPVVVIGDAVRLRQVLVHLLNNAIKFTPRGEVELRAQAEEEVPERCRVTFVVRDTGVGIPQDRLAHLFDSFSPLDGEPGKPYGGLGVGLPTVYHLLRLMGGEIKVASQVGQGSTFTIHLGMRVVAGARPAPAPRPASQVARAGGKRILVVEDDAVAQRIVAHMLARGKFQADTVGSGEAALAAASVRRYDLILMDLQMPGMDGIQAAEAIRSLPGYANVPIVALTAHTTEEYRVFSRQHGLDGFLSKPVRSEELLAVVKQHLGPAAQGEGSAELPGS